MELSEATALAGSFVTSVIFKAHSIPLNIHTERAVEWHQEQGSRIPLRAAFDEKRRHLSQFASRRRSDRRRQREIYLTISAIVDDYGNGQCPALQDRRCGIYEYRPLTCRTVPLHYSRQASVLKKYIDQFTSTTGYQCDTFNGSVVLDGGRVISPDLRDYRTRAVEVAKADRQWKTYMLSFMDDPDSADRAGLPTYDAILRNTDLGYATLVPMIVAWRLAEQGGLISWNELENICSKQAALIKTEISRGRSARDLSELLPLYEAGLTSESKYPPHVSKTETCHSDPPNKAAL